MAEKVRPGMDLDQLLHIPPGKDPALMNPLVLAYIGDTIYDLYIRQMLIAKTNHRPHHLHAEASKYVSAQAQAQALHELLPELTEAEREIVRRGRNAKSGSIAKNAKVMDYRHSTAFECLLGYLYYSRQLERMNTLLLKVTGQLMGDL